MYETQEKILKFENNSENKKWKKEINLSCFLISFETYMTLLERITG